MTIYNLIEACDACGIDTVRLRIIVYLLEHVGRNDGEIKTTYDSISRALGVSSSVVARTMKVMQNEGMIQSIGKGKWKLASQMLGPAEEDEEAEEFNLYIKNYCVENSSATGQKIPQL